jgi:hypothetical protein
MGAEVQLAVMERDNALQREHDCAIMYSVKSRHAESVRPACKSQLQRKSKPK